MTDTAKANDSAPKLRPQIGCLCLLGIPIFFLMMMAGIGTGLVDLGFSLLFGWIAFLSHIIPRISWDGGAIAAGILFTGLLLLLGHGFLSWLSQSIAIARGTTFCWPWKWTWCGLMAIGLCFLVGMAVTGAAHQIGWIASSKESLFESRSRKIEQHSQMHRIRGVAVEALQHTNTVDGLRDEMTRLYMDLERPSSRLPATLQSFHLLMLVDSNATVQGILILPRDPETQRTFGGEYLGLDKGGPMRGNELMRFIKANNSHLVSF
jgi:hypothetical protein